MGTPKPAYAARALACTLGIGSLAILGSSLSLAEEPPGAPPHAPPISTVASSGPLANLLWMVGPWQGDAKGVQVEEHWNHPLGDSMLGTFRAVDGGKAKFYEIMIIEAGGDVPVLSLKHFGRGLVPWAGEPQALTYTLVESDKDQAVFANPSATDQSELARRITYRRVGDNGLVVRLEGYKEGQIIANEYKFTRVTRK